MLCTTCSKNFQVKSNIVLFVFQELKKYGNQAASIRLQSKSHVHNHSLLTNWFIQMWFTCCSYQSQVKWFIAITWKQTKPLKPALTCQIMRLSILHEMQVSESSFLAQEVWESLLSNTEKHLHHSTWICLRSRSWLWNMLSKKQSTTTNHILLCK